MAKKIVHNISGFSLLEILLAIFLSGLLVTALLQTYLNVKKSFELQIELANITDNLRFEDYFLRQDIMQAGSKKNGIYGSLTSNSIYGYQYDLLPGYLLGKVVEGTDVIEVNKILITGDVEKVAFFISDTKRKDKKRQSLTALYYSINEKDKRELIADIRDMKVYYGIATNKDSNVVNRYYRAQEVKDKNLWDQVLSVRIELAMQNKLGLPGKRVVYIKLRGRG